MTVDVKICGLKEPQHVVAALDAGAQWVGFVFHSASPRNIAPEQVGQILLDLGSTCKERAFGLFVTPSDLEIATVLGLAPLAHLQVYDTPKRAAEIRARFGLPVWLSVAYKGRDSLPTRAVCDGYVIEAAAGPKATRPGGNAKTFDWTQLKDWQAPAPWMLAGGLTPENVADAITSSGARAVDVSSGVEHQPGVKSSKLITRFIKAAHASCA